MVGASEEALSLCMLKRIRQAAPREQMRRQSTFTFDKRFPASGIPYAWE